MKGTKNSGQEKRIKRCEQKATNERFSWWKWSGKKRVGNLNENKGGFLWESKIFWENTRV